MHAALTVGWVMDRDTSRRRIHVHLLLGGTAIGVTVETGERCPQPVVLDLDGATVLQGWHGDAVPRPQAAAVGKPV
mgnify:CR=1 FL=1